jgi:hypothetical protein
MACVTVLIGCCSGWRSDVPVTNEALWQDQVKVNIDPYGKAVIDVAREVMRLLDLPENEKFDCHDLICKADHAIENGGGITGFQAGCIANLVVQCHSRGEEFRALWNSAYDDKPHPDGVANPAIYEIKGE